MGTIQNNFLNEMMGGIPVIMRATNFFTAIDQFGYILETQTKNWRY
jgi:hypothetical protein